jgi:hypothetical protein
MADFLEIVQSKKSKMKKNGKEVVVTKWVL